MGKIEVKYPCGLEIKAKGLLLECNFDSFACPLHNKTCKR